jgi:purine catabolism regulator
LRDDLGRVPDLARRLHGATLSALAVRLGRHVDHIPAAALVAADELGFPIIVIDTDIAFNDVISAVLAIVLADYGPGRADPRAAHGRRPHGWRPGRDCPHSRRCLGPPRRRG